jgi:hypothetical protein
MTSLMKRDGSIFIHVRAAALGLAAFLCAARAAAWAGDAPPGPVQVQDTSKDCWSFFGFKSTSYGTPGYGVPGLVPGFQGFGLGYHLGYGYGGDALGTGAEGGYPFYGGPGYPRCDPILQRFGRITPFPYFGGPGYPTATQPNYYGGVGPLVAEQPVITVGDDPYDTGYGSFTGAIPYPESVLAPSTSRAAAGDGSSETRPENPPAPSVRPDPGTQGNAQLPEVGSMLGLDAESIVDSAGVRGLIISRVHRGSTAEKAGLRAGDVIHSINGYLTTQPRSLVWIISHAAPDKVLKVKVRTANDGKEHAVTAQLP